jgi:hypothetical protein
MALMDEAGHYILFSVSRSFECFNLPFYFSDSNSRHGGLRVVGRGRNPEMSDKAHRRVCIHMGISVDRNLCSIGKH